MAVTQILKAKTEPASNRIMRLLDCLSAYSFKLYYLKGKDMILADYLSRHHNEDEDPSDLIPISFCRLRDVEHFCVGTRASLRARGEMVPEVHGVEKELDPHMKPEQQYLSNGVMPKKTVKTPIQASTSREGLRSKADPVRVTPLQLGTDMSGKSLTECASGTPRRSPQPQAFLPTPISLRAHQKGDNNGESIENVENGESDGNLKCTRQRYNLGIDMGEGEEILDPDIKIPEESDLYEPEPLDQVVGVNKQWYKFLPKQGDVDQILAQINHKILRDTKLPLTSKDLKAAYLTSPHFKDVYLHLLQNRTPINKAAADRLEVHAHNYMILDDLLFKITKNNVGEMDMVLCIPMSKVHVLLKMCDGWTYRYYKVLSDYKSEVLLSQFSRATKSIHNWMPCVSAVQERQEI